MPLDPDRVKEVEDKVNTLSKRFDELIERRRINDAAEDEDDDDPEEKELEEASEEALALSPGSDLNPEDRSLASPEFEEPWWW